MSRNTEPPQWVIRVQRDRRVQRRRSARVETRGIRSNSACGVAKLGADGPARRLSSVSRACWTEPPLIRSPRGITSHNRIVRPPRQSSSQGTACGSWTRAWGQREPTHERTGRLRSPERQQLSQGWAGHPFQSRRIQLTSHQTPDPDVDTSRLVTRWSNRHLYMSSDNSILE